MNAPEPIRKYYQPIQPSVKAGQGAVSYQEIKPADSLQNYIHCYWQLRTHQDLDTPYIYRVVSDGCIDIFFNLHQTSESFVMGFCKRYTEFSIGKEFNYAGIRFYPAVFPQLFNVSAKLLKDKDLPLEVIFPKIAEWIAKEIRADFEGAVFKLDTYFESVVQGKSFPVDSRFQSALLEIYKRHGHLETERELNVGLSPRQLRRLFNYYIGTTPKSFSQVVRFQYILNAKPSSQSLRNNKFYFDVGFVDQAHFIKNFTQFYGVTPAKAFR